MARLFRERSWRAPFFIAAFTTIFLSPDLRAQPAVEQARGLPIDAVRTYLRATHARDSKTAYRHISSIDRSLRDETTYLRSQHSFSGFALELAKRLAADMEVWVIEQKLAPAKARLEVGYRVPTGDEIASQLLDWDPNTLNALSPKDQRRLFEAVDNAKNRAKLISIEGRETLDLVQERSGWKIYLDWRSRARVVFKAVEPRSGELAVRFLRNDFLVKTGDSFEIDLTVKNRTDNNLIVKLDHLFEPALIAESIDMIACGSLAPLHLRPYAVQSISSHYVLSGPVSKPTPLSIIYHFSAQPAVVKKKSFLNQVP